MKSISQVKLGEEFIVQLGKVLGKGATGSVYAGKDLKTNQKVAVKIIKLETIDNEVTQYLLKMEKNALMKLNNPYVLKGLKIWQNEIQCFMVTEFCNGTTLKQHIKSVGKLSEERSLQMVKCILEGYKNLVQQKVIHRDLKPANIMLHENYPKIIDFGYCQIAGFPKPTLQYNVGSPSYMSPQSYELNLYNEKTQIWAIGVILFQCLTGKTLDEGRQMKETYKEIEKNGIIFPHHVSQKSRKIINWCLSIDPKKRPTCNEVLTEIVVLENQKPKISLSINFNNQKKVFEKQNINNPYTSRGERKSYNPDKIYGKQGPSLSGYQPSRNIEKQKTERVNKYIQNKLPNNVEKGCQYGMINFYQNNLPNLPNEKKKIMEIPKPNRIGLNMVHKRYQQNQERRQKIISIHRF